MRFHVLLNSLFKVLFNFPSRYLFAIGLVQVFSLRWSLPPALGSIPKLPDSGDHIHERQQLGSLWDYHPLWSMAPLMETLPPAAAPSVVPHTTGPHSRLGLGDSVLGSSLFTRRY